MKRDFSEEAKEELLALVAEVEEEQWCEASDWLGDRWLDFETWIGKLDIKDYIDNISAYHKKVIDKNNATSATINSIFESVNGVSENYKTRFALSLTDLQTYKSMIDALAATVLPANGKFDAEYIGNGLKKSIEDYVKDSKGIQDITAEGLTEDDVVDWDEIGAANLLQKYIDKIAENIPDLAAGEEIELPLGFGVTLKYAYSVQVEGNSDEDYSVIIDAHTKKIKELQFVKNIGEECSIGVNSEDGIVIELGDYGFSINMDEGKAGSSASYVDGPNTYTVTIGVSPANATLELEIEISTAVDGGSVTSTYAIEYKPEEFGTNIPQPVPIQSPYISQLPEYNLEWPAIDVDEEVVAGVATVGGLVAIAGKIGTVIGERALNTASFFFFVNEDMMRMSTGLHDDEEWVTH